MKLSNQTLPNLPEAIKRPTYDRDGLTPGIVHIGLGNFHRAHQSWYLHRLMQLGMALDWAIIGAGVRPYDEQQRLKLAKQDYLTTLIELDPKGKSAEVVGSMIDYVPIEEGNQPLIAKMSEPAIRIVSLTVTESGYYVDPVTNEFDGGHEDIQHDVANLTKPRTAFGAIIAALKQRRDSGVGPFTVQSCDNLQGNGDLCRQTVVSLARLIDQGLASWIDENCTFPNSMVDCIVPATGPNEIALALEFGIDDAVPVSHENFRQWVIEDKFCAGRPDWDKVGATFSSDVHTYEAMKIRILNGGHQIVSNAGEVLSVESISGCMEHELIGAFFRKTAEDEIVPHVHPVPDITPFDYVQLIDYRFSNPDIIDTVRRVAFDGSSRHTGFLLPVLRDALEAEADIEGLVLAEALWARMCEGSREDGSTIEPNDPIWEELTKAAKEAKSNPQAWLDQDNLYGDLALNDRLQKSFDKWLTMIWQQGTEATLKSYLEL
jgi:mannitol 2-dehydrogenase